LLTSLSIGVTALSTLLYFFSSYIRLLILFELILTSAGLTLLNFEYLTLGLAGSFSALVILTLAGTEAVLGLSLAANASRSRPTLLLMTRSLKTTSLGSIFNSYIGDSPQPSTLSYI
jgi:NADH:ubiquinone oxidoreductase subunit K